MNSSELKNAIDDARSTLRQRVKVKTNDLLLKSSMNMMNENNKKNSNKVEEIESKEDKELDEVGKCFITESNPNNSYTIYGIFFGIVFLYVVSITI